MKEYTKLMRDVLENGDPRLDRTGTGTRALFGKQMEYDLSKGFPAMTTKKLAWKSVVSELLWFIEGSGNERRLAEIMHGKDSPKSTIWTDNAEASYWKPKAKFVGDLGRVYGVQWRQWRKQPTTLWGKIKAIFNQYETVDQLQQLVDGLKKDPFGRRHVLSAWNPGELDQMALPPCHMFAQFFVENLSEAEIQTVYLTHRATVPAKDRKALVDTAADGTSREGRLKTLDDLEELDLPTHKLSCQMYQRSADMFLGVPFNIASYSLLTHMLAQVCGYTVGKFVHVLGDAHIYENHVEQTKEQLLRKPFALPTLKLNPKIKNIDDFTMADIELVGYKHHEPIKAQMAV